jgi:hypothetical protein
MTSGGVEEPTESESVPCGTASAEAVAGFLTTIAHSRHQRIQRPRFDRLAAPPLLPMVNPGRGQAVICLRVGQGLHEKVAAALRCGHSHGSIWGGREAVSR